jgi:hypothetical protein
LTAKNPLAYSLLKWAENPSASKAWGEMMKQANGQLKNLFEGDLQEVFLGDFAFLAFGTLSMNKARRFGFCGFVDTFEIVFEMFQEMGKLGVLPPPCRLTLQDLWSKSTQLDQVVNDMLA